MRRGWRSLSLRGGNRVGLALTVGGIAGILTQTPAGALVDRLRSKRALIAAGIVALAAGALLIALAPTFWFVMSAQVLIGGTSSIFGPAICAVSLGIVGHRLFDRRQGRNQTFNSAGNVIAAVSMGLLQILDGVGAGIFGVVSVLVIADLTQGTGRFNLTLGAISTAVGIGASLSQGIAGSSCIILVPTRGFSSSRQSQRLHSAFFTSSCRRHAMNDL
jgi:MFS family permease